MSWARYLSQLLLMIAFFPTGLFKMGAAPRKGLQILRGFLLLAATTCTFSGLSFLPIADVTALSFLSPAIVTALSVIILKETVGMRRWVAVGVGFIGMLIIVRPGTGVFHPGALFPLAMAVFLGLYAIATRIVSHQTDSVTALFFVAVIGTIGSSLIVPFFWSTPTWTHVAMMAATGLLGGSGHFLLIVAYQRTDASAIAPFAYTELIWATALGLVIFSDFPDLFTWIGAAIIAASGLYIAHRERLARRATQPA
jgi:drug/metabolite transporter (DMT)-like permease